jgi:hypothetical protein
MPGIPVPGIRHILVLLDPKRLAAGLFQILSYSIYS